MSHMYSWVELCIRLTKPGFHMHPILQVWRFITLTASMPSISNFPLLFYEHMIKLCENSMPIAWCDVMLQLIKIEELDVWGSLFTSNLVTYVHMIYKQHEHNASSQMSYEPSYTGLLVPSWCFLLMQLVVWMNTWSYGLHI